METDSSCPNCQSGQWKAASLVHREGVSAGISRTKGTVVGVGRTGLRGGRWSVGGGVYRGKTSSFNQTTLSREASPPRMRTGLVIGLALVCLFSTIIAFEAIASGATAQGISLGLVALLTAFLSSKIRRREKQRYSEAVELYGQTRMCERCGTFYAPHGYKTVTIDQSRSINGICPILGILGVLLSAFAVAAHKSSVEDATAPVSLPENATAKPSADEYMKTTASDSGSQLSSSDEVERTYQISALGLLQDYDTNGESAGAHYHGKTIVVTGVLTGVFVPSVQNQINLANREEAALPFVTMGGPEPSSAGDAILLPGIDASSAKDSMFGLPNGAAPPAVGSAVSLRCTVGEFVRASVMSGTKLQGWPDAQIQLLDCTLNAEPASTAPSQPENDINGSNSSDGSTHVAPIVRELPAIPQQY
jgi:hypothetical protein